MSKWWARRRSSVSRSLLIAATTVAPGDTSPVANLGIYNYYDRWGERCPLTARCLTFAMEEESGTRAEDLDLANDRFWKKISESFQMAFSLLQDLADEEGVDLDAVVDEPKADEPKVVHLLPFCPTICAAGR